MFLDREKELADLDRLWSRHRAGMFILYGRRRVGKSSLLKQWGRDKPLFYWTATRTTSKRLLQEFSREFHSFKDPKTSLPGDFSYPTWEAALIDLAEYFRSQRMLVVFDEFPYAIEAEPEFPSLLQKLWDERFVKGTSAIGISGSRIGMIEKEIISSRGPLYGRASAIMWLDPLPFSVLKGFLPRYSPSQLVEVFSITGGVPLYIEMFDDSMPVLKNIDREINSTTSLFRTDPHFLLYDELKEPARYVAILEAMGAGKRSPTDIANAVGIEKTHVTPYLRTLEGLRYIKRLVPITEEQKASRKGAYVISDLFLKFYFRFIAPRMGLIESGLGQGVMSGIAGQFNSYVGKNGFEELCRRWFVSEARDGRLPFEPEAIGSYWDAEVEIDCAVLSKRHRSMIIGEAKWTGKKCGLPVLKEIRCKAQHLSKKFGFHVIGMIFSKAGFDGKLKERARIEQVRLVSADEVL